jgi:uncharacterized membrane-anchored protein YhcB (DUF1043 family)
MIPIQLQHQYIAWGLLATLLLLHWLWCEFVAYPISFEKNLKKGKSWVYIPKQWKGAYKFQIRMISRVIMLGLVGTGILLVNLYTPQASNIWYMVFGVALGFLVMRLDAIWLQIRYQQQEDSYYHLHDELRAKLEGEGKAMGEAAFKSLAAYQHQNLLRKADEQGVLIKTLGTQAKISRKQRKIAPVREPVET